MKALVNTLVPLRRRAVRRFVGGARADGESARAGTSARRGLEMSTPTRSTTWTWSVVIAALVTVASVWGLAAPGAYEQETVNWATQARGQDIGNLVAVVVLLLSCAGYERGSRGAAAVVWLGALLYLVYAYVIYAMALHFNQLFLVYVAILGLSCSAIVFSVDRMRAVDRGFPASGAPRLVGGISIVIGVSFAGLWLSELVPATVSGVVPQSVSDAGLWVNPVHVIDLALLLPAMVIAGVLSVRGDAGGQFFVGPLLVFSVLMGTSIVAAMALMALDGSTSVLPPAVMVSLVVLASAMGAWRHLERYATVPADRGTTTRAIRDLRP